jgi:hypothetical protein
MKIFFDQGTPAPLRLAFREHTVSTAYEMGWGHLDNGKLLAATEAEFDVLVTTDKNLRHQQNLTGRRLAVLILPTTNWPQLQAHQAEIAIAVHALRPGDVVEMKL